MRTTLCLYTFNLDLEKQRGELRKACSKYGHIAQPARRVNTTMRLAAFRNLMTDETVLLTLPIQAYLITSSDEHQSIDIDGFEKRREYISGFSGSYGDAVVTLDKAALWTDGRYHLQADEQLDCNWLLFREGHRGVPSMSKWLREQLPAGSRVGLNPKIVSRYTWDALHGSLAAHGISLVALNVSLVDVIWPEEERPPRTVKEAFVYDIEYAGKNYTTKVEEVRSELRKVGADAMVVTALDEIAWMLNIRGRDVPNSPYLRSYVVLDMQKVFLYVNSSQLNGTVRSHLGIGSRIVKSDSVYLRDYDDIWTDLRTESQYYKKILVPSYCVYSEGASHAIYQHIDPERRLPMQSPIIYLKALKNQVEIKGMLEANVKDSAAVCDCFAYIEQRITDGENFTELDVVRILDEYRYEQRLSLGNSFRTVVAFGENSAYPNYEPTINTNTQIFTNSTIVLDSGGQYFGGTTDITRTLHFGSPSDDVKEAYTRVLSGMIQLSMLTFPSRLKMAMVDVVARSALWEVGMDYFQDTGHGVGSFLGVRESPIKINFNSKVSSEQTFKPGYFLSNEPGYYRDGQFGIKLENILQVVDKPWLNHGGHAFLGFKVITLVPFEPNLIKLELLSPHQGILIIVEQNFRGKALRG
ncbi:unnamed protein product [Acanthoscelides obtectus]|uniref:Uncharacterized protein n=1 Tax=Acanthoscelides obtectus TaxID=200917 RepID=A0A9P0KL59_ACAOB|nr:unnamed protein product [Acanthoscelides obtectus]CAK1674887.1 Probable Xaa-Pro aminopeptidase P [Acanthoscelides obtectus]